jgi:NADPH:quinone reductase-like Zn-dependent oxidoreductase
VPCAVGYEVAGEVESVGQGVTSVSPGERVLIHAANTAAFQGVTAMTETPLASATYAVSTLGSTLIGPG